MLEIESYSIEQWGKPTAAKYLADIESGLQFIPENPNLLGLLEGLPNALRYYVVRKHLLICAVRPTSIIVLTVIHSSMDAPERLAELAPTLSAEVQILHKKISSARKKK